jgi:hypothetical protein
MAQLWRKPTSVHSGGAPLAVAYGSASSGVASVSFSAAQLSIDLQADSKYYDDLWMIVSAVQQADTHPAVLRWGWLRLVEAGFTPQADSSGVLRFVITDDVAYITYADVTYTLPVVLVGPTVVDSGRITVGAADEDILYFHYLGKQWSAPSTQVPPPPDVGEGSRMVINDVLYVTQGGVSHTVPVASAGVFTFVVLNDVVYISYAGVDYALPVALIGPTGLSSGTITVAEDTLYFHYLGQHWSAPSVQVTPPRGAAEGTRMVLNDVLYVTLAGISHTAAVVSAGLTPPAPTPGTPGTTLVTGSDMAQYERTVYSDGTIRYKPCYETLP